MRTRLVAVLSAFITACWFVVGPAPAAFANPTCTGGSPNSDHTGAKFTPTDNSVGGIRAPIQARLNGVICDSRVWGGTVDSFTAAWIGIEDVPDNKIAQIGLVHIFDNLSADAYWCRFYEAGQLPGASPVIYGNLGSSCTQTGSSGPLTNDVFQYFNVKVIDVSGTKKYSVNDCGQSNPSYSGCTEVTRLNRFPTERGVAEAESDSSTSCQNNLMGSLGDAQDYGTTTNNLQTMGDFGGTWGVHTLNDLPTAICSGSTYVHTIGTGSQFISTYDSRN